MTTPEGKIKDKVKKLLYEYEVYYFMPVQMGYGAAGLDFHCNWGRFGFLIETKAEGKKLVPRQEILVAKLIEKNVPVFIIDGDGGLKMLESFLIDIQSKHYKWEIEV
jgi:hypothetical protein